MNENFCVYDTWHEKKFHAMQACERFNFERYRITFVSYVTPIATYDGITHMLYLHTNPYAYSVTTSRQFNRWLREKFYCGDDIISDIKEMISDKTNETYSIECYYSG